MDCRYMDCRTLSNSISLADPALPLSSETGSAQCSPPVFAVAIALALLGEVSWLPAVLLEGKGHVHHAYGSPPWVKMLLIGLCLKGRLALLHFSYTWIAGHVVGGRFDVSRRFKWPSHCGFHGGPSNRRASARLVRQCACLGGVYSRDFGHGAVYVDHLRILPACAHRGSFANLMVWESAYQRRTPTLMHTTVPLIPLLSNPCNHVCRCPALSLRLLRASCRPAPCALH